jgi:hypothetical protein
MTGKELLNEVIRARSRAPRPTWWMEGRPWWEVLDLGMELRLPRRAGEIESGAAADGYSQGEIPPDEPGPAPQSRGFYTSNGEGYSMHSSLALRDASELPPNDRQQEEATFDRVVEQIRAHTRPGRIITTNDDPSDDEQGPQHSVAASTVTPGSPVQSIHGSLHSSSSNGNDPLMTTDGAVMEELDQSADEETVDSPELPTEQYQPTSRPSSEIDMECMQEGEIHEGPRLIYPLVLTAVPSETHDNSEITGADPLCLPPTEDDCDDSRILREDSDVQSPGHGPGPPGWLHRNHNMYWNIRWLLYGPLASPLFVPPEEIPNYADPNIAEEDSVGPEHLYGWNWTLEFDRGRRFGNARE